MSTTNTQPTRSNDITNMTIKRIVELREAAINGEFGDNGWTFIRCDQALGGSVHALRMLADRHGA